MEILLNEEKNINTINKSIEKLITLDSTVHNINQFDLHNIISAAAIYDKERQSNAVYRICGKLNNLSMLNGLKREYDELGDFFSPQLHDSKNIFNSFDFYLVIPNGPKPINSDSLYENIPNSILYKREFKIIATPNHIDILNAGFSKNIFGEQEYNFIVNIDINIIDVLDGFNFPITEIYLLPVYKPNTIPCGVPNHHELTYCNTTSIREREDLIELGYPQYNLNDIVKTINNITISDVVEYKKNDYIQNIINNFYFYIETPYLDNEVVKYLRWKYNPLIPLKLRYLSGQKYEINTNSPDYSKVQEIPIHATNTINDVYVWREIQSEGYYDPVTGNGNNIPFINGRRYFFNSIIFDINPDLSHKNTRSVFEDIWFTNNNIINNYIPNSNLNDFGKPCK